MSDQRPSAQLIPFGEVQRLVQERRRRMRPAAPTEAGSFSQPRNTSQVRRLLTEHRGDSPSGPEAA